ncbi:MAG TPA: hypothetical protein VEL76_31485 [Gemmataceae bacterium]|nr:hypothetical protein [Gemmataceae bacterium]
MQLDDNVICRCADQIVELVRRLPPEDIDRLRAGIVSILVAAVELPLSGCWKARRKLGPCGDQSDRK